MERFHERLRSSSFTAVPFARQRSAYRHVLLGRGCLPNEERQSTPLLVVFDFPSVHESRTGDPVSAEENLLVDKVLQRNGIDTERDAYFTYLFKIRPEDVAAVTPNDYVNAVSLLQVELNVLRPRVVVCIGRYSSTAFVAAHLDTALLGQRRQWHTYERRMDDEQRRKQEFMASWRMEENIRSHWQKLNVDSVAQRLQGGEAGAAPSNGNATVNLIALSKVEGLVHRVYDKRTKHSFWCICSSNPNFAVHTRVVGNHVRQARKKVSRVEQWVANFEQVKMYMQRAPPIQVEHIEQRVREEFRQRTIVPDTHKSVVERFRGDTYERRRRRLALETLRRREETLRFQVTKIEYDQQLNEYDVYGKMQDGSSVFCSVPHMHGEHVFHFYIKYPKCWRTRVEAQRRPMHTHPQFGYEKDYEAETHNHEAYLFERTQELKRRLVQKLEQTKCSAKRRLQMQQTSACTERLEELCRRRGAEYVRPPDTEWSLEDELCDVRMERSFKYQFRSYDTQQKPRVRITVKYHPMLPWIVQCLEEMVHAEDADEQLTYYEVDCTPVQRFTLHHNVYVGGWVEVDPHCYEIVTGIRALDNDELGVRVLDRYAAHHPSTNPLGLKRSACDLEVITFLPYMHGHNPNEDLELALNTNALLAVQKQINADVRHHSEQYAQFCSQHPDARESEKYQHWRRIQQRRLQNLDKAIAEICSRRGIESASDTKSESKLKQWSKNAPLRILVMDIECMTDGKTFPSAENCPIICIVAYVQTLDHTLKVERKSGTTEWDEVAFFSLGPLDKKRAVEERMQMQGVGTPKNLNIYCFDSERELLRAWLLFRCDRDPDIESGHNIEFFDMPYLSRRCEVSGAYDTPIMSCIYGTKKLFSRISISQINTFSKAFGEKKQIILQIPGCSCLDTMTVFQKEEKLSSYSLNSLALQKFGDKKADLPYVAIPGTFYRDRNRLLMYNDKDTNITIRLLLYKNTCISSLEFIKLAGVYCQQDVFVRGQQFKVLNCIMRSIENDGAKYVIETNRENVERLLEKAERSVIERDDDDSEDETSADPEFHDTAYDSDLSDREDDPGTFGIDSTFGGAGGKSKRKKNERKRRHVEIRYDDDESDESDQGDVRVEDEEDEFAVRSEEMDMAIVEALSTPETSDDEEQEIQRAQKRMRLNDNIAAINTMSEFSSFIDQTVVDKAEKSKKPFQFRSAAQRKQERKRRREQSGRAKRKLTAKQRKQRERDAKSVPRIDSFFQPKTSVENSDAPEKNEQALQALRERRLQKKKRLYRKQERKRRKLEKEGDGGVAYQGATCIEPRRGFHIYKDKETGKWAAVFVLCCDFSSLYPTVDIGNNICHEKKMFLRKLNKLRVPLQFCQASTEAWPDAKNENRRSYAYFLHSTYRQCLFERCRSKETAEELCALLKLVWYNRHWRHLTNAYRRVLEHWGVDTKALLNDEEECEPFVPVPDDYVPPIAQTNEFKPEPKENLDFEAHDCGNEYGKYNQSLDVVLLNFWEDDSDNDVSEYPMRGILPKYLTLCLSARKLVKVAMKKAEPGSAEQKSLDGVQLSYKITANSGYGVTGTMTGKLGDYAISATITGYGRRYLEFVKNFFLKGTGETYTFRYKHQQTGEQVEEPFVFKGGENYGGDTDSFFNSIYGVDYAMVERMGEKQFERNMQILADLTNAQLPPPVCLLFEKIMYPFISVNKKRYAYIDFDRTKICSKGLELVRRDNCPLLRRMQKTVFKKMLIELDIEGAIQHVREQSKLLLEGKVDIMDLVVTKQCYKSDYKTDTLPHLITIKKKAHRGDPPVEIGQRVPYVIIKGTSDVKNSSINADDPTYVLENDLVIDYEYYLQKQVKKPMARIFSRVPGINSVERANKSLFSNLTQKRFSASLLPSHPIARYVRRVQECVSCGQKSFQLCCQECFEKRIEAVESGLRTSQSEAFEEWRRCIDVCKRCLNQDEDEVACENTPCPEYAPRKRAIAGKRKADNRYERLQEMKRRKTLDW